MFNRIATTLPDQASAEPSPPLLDSDLAFANRACRRVAHHAQDAVLAFSADEQDVPEG